MAPILSLALQILQIIPTVSAGVSHLWAWIVAIRAAAKQSGEWTQELETAFVNGLILRATSGDWLTDAET